LPSLVDLSIQLEVIDPLTVGNLGYEARRRWIPGAGVSGKREDVTLTASSFSAFTVPTGAKFALIDVGSAVSLTLKGVTSDTGIAICPASGPLQIPVLMPLNGTPSIGIANGANVNQVVSILWL